MQLLLIFSLFTIRKYSRSCIGGFRYVLVVVKYFLIVQCVFFRYHARDASVILQEQASQDVQETQEAQEEYEYEYDTRQSRPCGEGRQGQNPRILLGINQEEDMNNVPCCNLDKDDYIQEEESSDVIQLGLRLCLKL